ncbi:AlpA family phage regulatory protein [Vibrio parahaemolyticus]|uniref:helix-turn-helix transcriptional regulator n=1 Tax=Vibrio parahaemolyticus TaxID=670 RepID=UPI0011243D99|nr:AlpA family phage regulatory protein [Vibrio parahaemolyticus]EGR0923096.1 AlpA family phage regulatory protein [Vibrio parahaemolyticus]EGR1757765.1 AlpA family phage regulatory protein [Vibrio parahaemolyticus]EJG1895711.1 AlpA family phage regulatory protein [Vibrio parahaemolyticus]MBE3899975.1 AlpA family phage regulatory protein [Vibrio parahaemolyticus]MCG9634969.1 AlpA family phage regulatory protein [Vibrio parahaemolyticus]
MSTPQYQASARKTQHNVVPRFYDLKAIMDTFGISRNTIWKMVETSHFPKPVQLFSRRVAWPDHEVEKMVTLLSADLPKDELVKRVEEIHAARKELAQ